MKKLEKKDLIVYTAVGCLLAIAMTMLMSVQVKSRTQENLLFDNRNYEAAEVAYREGIQSLLESYGCCQSGITMTRVVSLDGERAYRVQIYNAKLRTLAPEVFAGLQKELESYRVEVPGGKSYGVEVSFLK